MGKTEDFTFRLDYRIFALIHAAQYFEPIPSDID
jgi:hypothetical protein